MVRAWLRRADGVYDLHEQWDQFPVVDQIGRHVRDEARFDTLTPWAWDFAGDYGHEGWTSCSDSSLELASGALEVSTDGCASSPDWTAIDTDLFDQVVVQLQSETAGEAELAWGLGPDAPTGGLRFETTGAAQTVVVSASTLRGWDGVIRWLQMQPGVGPAATRVGSTQIDAVWVQHSGTQLSTGPGFSTVEPVSGVEPELPPPVEDPELPPIGDPIGNPLDSSSSTLRSSTGCASSRSGSATLLALLGVAFGTLRRRR